MKPCCQWFSWPIFPLWDAPSGRGVVHRAGIAVTQGVDKQVLALSAPLGTGFAFIVWFRPWGAGQKIEVQ
jgi:hypothetical protein